jgi:hypothetical protein
MTLVTGGESPKHSKWHLVSGTVVLLGAFVVTMFAVERHIGLSASDPAESSERHIASADRSSEPAHLHVASRD